MKSKILITALSMILIGTACKKNASVADDVATEEIASEQIIAVGLSTTTGEQLYVVNVCERNQKKDSISFNDLPAPAVTYLSANYNGYTSQKAFAIKDPAGTIAGYVAIINYNGNPVGVRFDVAGYFIKVLEQREGCDIKGPGWHHGGHFNDRDGRKKDTIALTSLPSSIINYFVANYSQDTLVRAFRNRDNSVVVISTNNGIFATVFSANGTFINRTAVPCKPGKGQPVDISAIPSVARAYLSTTYPGYVFKHAFIIRSNTGVAGYVVFIDANNTKYAVEFDGAGSFVKSVTVR